MGDRNYKMSSLATLTGTVIEDLFKMERFFLMFPRYDCFVGMEEFEKSEAFLVHEALR